MMNRSIYRQFVRYTIPTVAAMLVNGLYQVVDGIFIGHYVGAEGLAGINVAWPVIGTPRDRYAGWGGHWSSGFNQTGGRPS